MSESVQYDPVAIQSLAKWYCRRSMLVLVFYPVLFALLCSFAFYELGGYELGEQRAALIGAGVGAFLGYLFGSLRSKSLKLQAQVALCQQQIEENTRSK
jgi:hypothetical protein